MASTRIPAPGWGDDGANIEGCDGPSSSTDGNDAGEVRRADADDDDQPNVSRNDLSSDEEWEPEHCQSSAPREPVTLTFNDSSFIQELSAVFDGNEESIRGAERVLRAVFAAGGADLSKISLSKSTIARQLQEGRRQAAQKVQH